MITFTKHLRKVLDQALIDFYNPNNDFLNGWL